MTFSELFDYKSKIVEYRDKSNIYIYICHGPKHYGAHYVLTRGEMKVHMYSLTGKKVQVYRYSLTGGGVGSE